MNKENIKKVIQNLEEAGREIGIELVRSSGFKGENSTRVFLDMGIDVEVTGTDEEISSDAIRVLELAKHLNSKAVFYEVKVKMWGDEVGYGIKLYFISTAVMYEAEITLPSYINIEEEEESEREEQLTAIGKAVEKVFGNADFDSESLVENSFFPYLERNNITKLNIFTNLNSIVEGWLEEIMGIKNLAYLISELTKYWSSVYNNTDHNYRDPTVPFMKSLLLHKLAILVPYTSEDNEYKEKEIKEKIIRLDLSIYTKLMEVKMTSSDPKDVEKITTNFLNYRKKLGIRNPRVTKQEIEEYLRITAYDTIVPKELLRNAMYDIVNKPLYNN